ncbi:signal peptidase I [Lachnobacterium bovis]|uniref:Signal peptidase I n=1 Tax=Lachnobacterium bovis TaxID=140626 RepID=A0A1H9RX35_9FIRM|nr:signal peptidase I [Lachnobacterium bovis]SER76459.1 signal peptidase I [Lachnobacterium bovis]
MVKEKKESRLRSILGWILTIALAMIAALCIKNYVIINAIVPTGSMEKTIKPGDNIFGNRLAYLWDNPRRGDIIIFYAPDDLSQKFIKRIIGLPGDKIKIMNGKIYINDSKVPLKEDYLKEDWYVMSGPLEYKVPENSYFVMGDNRNNSNDSRYWKHTFVKKEYIIGKGIFIYFPFEDFGEMK